MGCELFLEELETIFHIVRLVLLIFHYWASFIGQAKPFVNNMVLNEENVLRER